MATIYYKIFKHHRKKDGKYNIKYCLTHKGKQVYHASTHHVSDGQLKKDFTLKDRAVLSAVSRDIADLEGKVSQIGMAAERLTAPELLSAITVSDQPEGIDFIRFSREHLESLRQAGREGTAGSMRPHLNNLIDFIQSDSIDVNDITSTLLRRFEKFLTSPRKQVRVNQFGDEVVMRRKGLGAAGVHNNMRTIRILFNECRRTYNTEFSTPVAHYPFDFYKIPQQPSARKRGGDLGVNEVKAIRDITARPGSRKALARDFFMLSFYLCGMNAKDIYDHDWEVTNGRIGYERSKTAGRSSGSFISIRIPDEAAPLLESYHKKYLHRRLRSHQGLLTAISKGMNEISEEIGVKATFYHARHTFATLARNKCGFSKDDIAAALNHVGSKTVTDRYLDDDWSVVDRVQDGVLGLLSI